MTKTAKKIARDRQYNEELVKSLNNQLLESNTAYNYGAFKYLRCLVHILAASQFIYGIYFHVYHVNWPQNVADEEELKTRWGGKFKYLTFLNVILQALYHCLAFLNDIWGSNELTSHVTSKLRIVRDYVFAAWAFPVALNVCISFWVIYAWDRELIFPASLDDIFPSWLNHVVHTNVAMLAIMDLFTCFRKYPRRLAGISGNLIFILLYVIWVHIVRYFSGLWVYPLLEVLNWPMRYCMLSALMGFNLFCYYLGEYINCVVWKPELRLVKMHKNT